MYANSIVFFNDSYYDFYFEELTIGVDL